LVSHLDQIHVVAQIEVTSFCVPFFGQIVLIVECHGPLSDLDRLPCKGAKEVCMGFGWVKMG